VFIQTTVHDLFLWLNLIGAGLFTYFYLRRLGLNEIPSLIGGVAWMFHGYVMVWFEFENIPTLAMALPATLFFLETWLQTRRLRYFFLFSAAIAYAISSHFAHILIYQALFIGIYFSYRYVQLRIESKGYRLIQLRHSLLIFSAVMAVLCTSAPFLYKNFVLLGDGSQRSAYTFDELYRQTGQLHGRYLATLIFPDFFGSPVTHNAFTPRTAPQPYNNYNELCIYSGIMTLFLIIAAAFNWRKRKHTLFFLATAVVTISIAMGSLLYYPLVKVIPGLNLSTPTRILYLFGFSMSILAGFGAEALSRINGQNKWQILCGWCLLSIIAIGVLLLVGTEHGIRAMSVNLPWMEEHKAKLFLQHHFSFASPAIREPLLLVSISMITMVSVLFNRKAASRQLFLFLALLVLSYDLMTFGRAYNTLSQKSLAFPKTPAIDFLKKQTPPFRVVTFGPFMHNALSPFGIEDIGGYASFYPERYGQYIRLSQNGKQIDIPSRFSRWVSFKKFGSPLLNLINAKYLLVHPSVIIEKSDLAIVYRGEINIYENKNVIERVFFVPAADICPDRQSAYNKLSEYTTDDFKKKVILESSPITSIHKGDGDNVRAQSIIQSVVYGHDRIEIKATTDRNGFIVISDNFHPEWRGEVNGQEAEILRANYIMRAIPVQTGEQRIVLNFKTQQKLMVHLAAVGWALLAGLTITAALKRM
jgi:hypothetical protein